MTSQVSKSTIQVTAQQSRFHVDTLESQREIDIHDLNISYEERELLAGAHLRLKEGVKYALVGRNGSGKSSLFQAIADKLIPGIGKNITILLLSQVEETVRAEQAAESVGKKEQLSVLEHTIKGDKIREKSQQRLDLLTKAIDSPTLVESQRVILELKRDISEEELFEARKIALRRSGARGKEARQAEINAEKDLAKQLETLKLWESDKSTWDPLLMQEAMSLLEQEQLNWELTNSATVPSRAVSILKGLGFNQTMLDSPYTHLSGGWRSRCALAVSLIVYSDVLLLDEPSNFLDLESLLFLERYIHSLDQTVVVVSHDQEFINNAVEETIILRNGTLKYFEGTPRAFEITERKDRKMIVTKQEAMDKKKQHIEKSIKQGIASAKKTGDENRQRMVKSRQKKLDERWGNETSAKGTRFKLNRDLAGYHLSNRSELELEKLEPEVKIRFAQPEKLRTTGDLIHFQDVEFAFPKRGSEPRKVLLSNISFTVQQGGRVAFVGANGQGKSTLAKLILGKLQPTNGTITRHPLLQIGYFSQHSVEELTHGQEVSVTALQYFLRHFEKIGKPVQEQDARRCLGTFGLQGGLASDVPLTLLSGGQKVRLALSLILYISPPLLVLDEVTTHVDGATVLALSKGLRTYSGAVVLITHDRWFSRVVIERESLNQVLKDETGGSALEDLSSESEEEERGGQGITYLVGGGKLKVMEKGMKGYVDLVQRKLDRAEKKRTG